MEVFLFAGEVLSRYERGEMGKRAHCASEEKLLALRQMRQAAWTKSLSCDSAAGTRASCNVPVSQPALA